MTGTATTAALELPLWLEMLSLVVGALGCALTGCDRKLDVLGCVGLGLLGGLGGGLIRDTIMQVGSVYMIDSAFAIPTCVSISIIVFFFHGLLERWPETIEWLDIFSVALFAASGCDKAVMYGLSPIAAVFMGLMTANGGGMLRDIFLGDVPRIFQKSNLYAVCGLAGSATYWLMVEPLGLDKGLCTAGCVLVTVALRRASLHFNWQSPADVDLTPELAGRIRRLTRPRKHHPHKH